MCKQFNQSRNTAFHYKKRPPQEALRRQPASAVDLSSTRLLSTGLTGGIIIIIIVAIITRSILLFSLLILFLLLVALGYSVKFLYKKWTEAKDYDPEAEDYEPEAEDSREEEEENVRVTTV